jgi:hypothetical protein
MYQGLIRPKLDKNCGADKVDFFSLLKMKAM